MILKKFNSDIAKIEIDYKNKGDINADKVNQIYSTYERDFINILNKHAPLKSRYPRQKPLPCINGELRRAIHRKHMLYTNFTKNRNNLTWDKFRQHRNLVNKLKRKSMKVYFLERYSGGSKISRFLEYC